MGLPSLEIRLLEKTDEPDLKAFFSRVSDESIHRRFMHMRRGMREEQMRKLLDGDSKSELALVATVTNGAVREIAGIGQYFLDSHGRSAEFALLVRDDFQGKGVGTALLASLRAQARAHGITALTASVLQENGPMLHIADKAGFESHGRMQDGVLSLRAALDPVRARAGSAG